VGNIHAMLSRTVFKRNFLRMQELRKNIGAIVDADGMDMAIRKSDYRLIGTAFIANTPA
jgi:hypothetical protein